MDMAAKRKRKIFARLRLHFVAVHSTKKEYLHRNYLHTSRKSIRIANLKNQYTTKHWVHSHIAMPYVRHIVITLMTIRNCV